MNPHATRGMTLIETLVGIVLIVIVFVGLYGAFQLSVSTVSAAKGEAGADSLVRSHMEYMRSLSYADVGNTTNIPLGIIPPVFTKVLGGISYSVQTVVRYVDDPADGLAASGDADADDYKMFMITVSWETQRGGQSISATSYVVPPTIGS